jgi:DNA polymerase elongation subunit (family B)
MSKKDDLVFQLIDIDHFHDVDEDSDRKVFKIRLFGKTADDKSVYLEVDNFKPFFYVEIDHDWRKSQISRLIDHIKERVWPKEFADGFIKYDIVEKYKFYGFTNYKKYNFIKLTFDDHDSMQAYARAFSKKRHIVQGVTRGRKGIKFKVYESNITPILRFLHIQNIDAMGWVKVKAEKLNKFEEFYEPAITDIQYNTDWRNVERVESTDIHKFTILSFDLECTSEDGHSFPKADKDGDKIIQIGMTLSRCGETECYKQILLSLKKTAPIPGTDVRWFHTEEELMIEFSKLIRELDPDVITGYNIFGFDFPYLKDRAKHLGIYSKFSRLSRLKNHVCDFVDKKLSSSALGQNKMYYYKMDGRVIIDVMKVVQRDFKLAAYKLDYVASYFIREKIKSYVNNSETTTLNVSSTFGIRKDQFISIYYNDGKTENNVGQKKYKVLDIGEKDGVPYLEIDDPNVKLQEYIDAKYKVFWCQAKDDVSPQDIFACYEGSSSDRALVGKYCIQDCALCNRLMGKLSILTNNIGMANVCHVPLSYLFLRGQGVKIFSLVARQCRLEDHLIPVIRKKQKKTDEQKAEQEKNDKNFDKFVNYLTYRDEAEASDDEEDDEGYEGATVFPPVKGVHYSPIPVLDFASLYPNSMILMNLSHESFVNDDKYDNLPGYKYHEIHYTSSSGNTVKCRFAEKEDGTKSIIPRILMDLLATRKKYKKLMGAEKNPFVKSIYDGLQLAYKVTANSLYGQTGASTSPIYMKEIAASTTATGRDMLQYAKLFIEDMYTKILDYALRGKEKKMKKYMRELFKDVPDNKVKNEKDGYDGKEEFFTFVYKKSRDILTGYDIDPKVIYGDSVTEDTPLLLKIDGEIVIEKISNINTNKSNVWYDYGDGKKASDTPNIKVWTEEGWKDVNKIIKHTTKKKIYRVTTHTGSVDVTEDHSLVDKDKNKIKPGECEVGTELLQSFTPTDNETPTDGIEPIIAKILGMQFAMGDKEAIKKIIVSSKDNQIVFYKGYINAMKSCNVDPFIFKTKIMAAKMYALLNNIGFDVTIEDYDNMDSYKLSIEKNVTDRSNSIVQLRDVSDYYYAESDEITVYDLETENHHFQAGVGNIIVHNTDSVFFCMNIVDKKTGVKLKDQKSLEMSIKLGIFASDIVNLLMPWPMNLEYEKVLWPFIILTKKRYVGNLYEFDPNSYAQKSMGIVMKRRDNADIVKVVVGGIIDKILNERDPAGAVEYTRDMLQKIITGKFAMDKYIITKTLKDMASYKDWTRITHAVLAHRMGVRNPGNEPQSNDRIPYVYIETKGKPKLQGDRVEHPDYVVEHNLKLDYLFYITNQIMKPALQFLELIAYNPDDIFKDYIIKEQNWKKGIMPLMSVLANESEGSGYTEAQISDEDDFDSDTKHSSKKKSKKKGKNDKYKKVKKSPESSKDKKKNKGKKDKKKSAGDYDMLDESNFVDFTNFDDSDNEKDIMDKDTDSIFMKIKTSKKKKKSPAKNKKNNKKKYKVEDIDSDDEDAFKLG